jgi:hypothetical protein
MRAGLSEPPKILADKHHQERHKDRQDKRDRDVQTDPRPTGLGGRNGLVQNLKAGADRAIV